MKSAFEHFWENKWMLSISAGILLGFSFPPFPFPFLQFPAFLLFFRLIYLSNSARQAAYYSYPGFLIWNILSTYWLVMASIPAGVAAILANAVLMALTLMLMFIAQKRLSNPWLIGLLQTSFWLSFEYLHHQWDLSWPWLTLANGWSNAAAFIQYISITGFWGISVWILLVSSLTFQVLKTGNKKVKYTALAIFLLFPAISLLQLSTLSLKSESSVETVVVQPNFDSYQPLGGFETPQQTLALLLRQSDSVRTDETDLILWPENGIQPYLTNRKNAGRTTRFLKQRILSAASNWDAVIIGGTRYYEYFYEDPPPVAQQSDETPFLTYNSAIAFFPDGDIKVYRKHNLVTVVERFPFVNFFNAIDIFGWVNWAEVQGFGQGSAATVFETGPTKTFALICYDSVYPGWIRKFVKNGAGFITIITNDGWWGNSSGHIQHFAYARLRAIEFRRWVVRSANNGISGIIAPDGSVKVKTEYWTRTAFRYEVLVLNETTFYTRFGNWLPIGLLIISIFGIGYLIVNKR